MTDGQYGLTPGAGAAIQPSGADTPCRTRKPRCWASSHEQRPRPRIGGISGPFIRHPVATAMLMIALLLVGIISYCALPIASLPAINQPTIQVTPKCRVLTRRPWRPPSRRRWSATRRDPRADADDLVQRTGFTEITLQFDRDTVDFAAAGDVQAALNAAAGDLPKTMPTPPTYRKTNPADAPILLLALTSKTLPLTTVMITPKVSSRRSSRRCPGVGLVGSAASNSRRCAWKSIRCSFRRLA